MPRIAIRCDGGSIPEIGTGHIVRMLDLADALIASGRYDASTIVFVTRSDRACSAGVKMIEEAGFQAVTFDPASAADDGQSAERSTLLSVESDLVIIDRLDSCGSLVQSLRSAGRRVVTFDDNGGGAAISDLTINAIVPTRQSARNILEGSDYLILPNARKAVVRPPDDFSRPPRRLIATFGGYDHRGLASLFLKALGKLDGIDMTVVVTAGGLDADGFDELSALARACAMVGTGSVTVEQRLSDFVEELSLADIAVSGGGLSLLEFLACGIPTLAIPQYDHQRVTIDHYARRDALVGFFPDDWGASEGSIRPLVAALENLMMDHAGRYGLSHRARNHVGRDGLMRVRDSVLAVSQAPSE